MLHDAKAVCVGCLVGRKLFALYSIREGWLADEFVSRNCSEALRVVGVCPNLADVRKGKKDGEPQTRQVTALPEAECAWILSHA